MPLMCQPRAKLGLSASARSANAIMAADVFAEIRQSEGGIRQAGWIVAGYFDGAPGENRCPSGCTPPDRRSAGR
jgi:hypothetical protein